MRHARSTAIAAILILSLSACATTDMTGWTPEQIYAYKAAEAQQMAQLSAQLNQQNQQLNNLNQSLSNQIQGWTPPEAQSYTQPNTYSHYYCRNAAAQIVSCTQLGQ